MQSNTPKKLSPPPQRKIKTKHQRTDDQARKSQPDELVLPKAEETEREVLGIFLFAPDSIQKAIECGLSIGLFALKSHQTIFSAMKTIHEKGQHGPGWSLTAKSLMDYLDSQHALDKVGGGAYLSDLIDGRVSGPERLAGLIQQLKDVDYKRQTMKKGVELQTLAGNGASPAEIEEFLDTIPRTHTTVQKYTVTASGIVYRKPARFGFGYENENVTKDFTAKIVAEITEDDGSSEKKKIFEIEVMLKGQTQRIEVPAIKFEAMSWVTSELGAEAAIYPGKKEHARFAIQAMSPVIAKRTVYAHTGWRQIENEWKYLHGGGAITAQGNQIDISVRLPDDLRHFLLPAPATGEDLIGAFHVVLELLDAFPRFLSVSLVGAVFGAILCEPDYSIYVAGESGSFKSEATAIAQSFFGAEYTRLSLPGNWSDSWLSILAKSFIMKDALMIIDDFSPTGDKRHDDELHNKAETVFRAAGNRSGKGGLRSDLSLRVSRRPRGVIGSSGEDLPRNFSVQNRIQIMPIKKGDITPSNLSAMQKMAAQGKFALSASSFISHVARDYETIKRQFDEDRIVYRDKLASQLGGHARQATMTAHLAAAWRAWIRAAVESKAISEETAKKLWAQVWKTLKAACQSQKDHQAQLHPVDHFLDLLRSSLTSGKAHLATPMGGEPPDIGPLSGWREGRPHGECVGWVDAGILYLQMTTAFGVANAQGLRNNQGLAVSQRTLEERLDDRKLIIVKEPGRYHKCRAPINRMSAVAIPLIAILPDEEKQPSRSPTKDENQVGTNIDGGNE